MTDEERRSFSLSVRLRSNWTAPLSVTLFTRHIPSFKAAVNADHIIKCSFRLCFSQTVNTDSARTVCVRVCAHVSIRAYQKVRDTEYEGERVKELEETVV